MSDRGTTFFGREIQIYNTVGSQSVFASLQNTNIQPEKASNKSEQRFHKTGSAILCLIDCQIFHSN